MMVRVSLPLDVLKSKVSPVCASTLTFRARYPVLLANVRRRSSNFMLPQDADDLLFAET
jgi:hypothetical protein